MNLILEDNIKIKIEILTKFWDRFKNFKFKLHAIDYGICLPKCRKISTYFLCQNIDIVMTDKENKVLYTYPNHKTESFIFWKRKVYNTYLLPIGACNFIKVGDKLKFEQEKRLK